MRRRAAIATVTIGAVAAGAGTALWRSRGAALPDPASSEVDLWSLSFNALNGSVLAMQSLRGRPLLLNFWATWCAPCVTEMPMLDAFAGSPAAAAKKWQVLALAVDNKPQIEKFVSERALRIPVALAGAAGLELAHALGNAGGGLPFSVVFSTAGIAVAVRLGALQQADLDRWLSMVD